MALGMAAKSLIILLYEILSSHVRAFKKWASLKAYVILNALEIVFWGAVAFLMIQANIKFCSGLSCTLSWVVVVLAGIMSQVALYMTVVAWFDFRYFRANGVHRGSKYATDATDITSAMSVPTGSWPTDASRTLAIIIEARAEAQEDTARDPEAPRTETVMADATAAGISRDLHLEDITDLHLEDSTGLLLGDSTDPSLEDSTDLRPGDNKDPHPEDTTTRESSATTSATIPMAVTTPITPTEDIPTTQDLQATDNTKPMVSSPRIKEYEQEGPPSVRNILGLV
ncbi:hypothetical protein QQX98_009789 [Neonectria punicea]|uniref:MARVEL domain-containing protein n=1 Tax=Neonectria punicea TaxID=979145 RepID=A0ABR1GRQ0_9HYPO